MSEELKNKQLLIDACFFCLGWIIANGGMKNDAAYFMASALKRNGYESLYIDAILKAKDERPRAT